MSSPPPPARPAPVNSAAQVPHAQAAWDWFNALGAPKHWVAPMVDQSELAFRLLCRRHGADASYTPMLHARLFLETPSYREEHFTTAPGDRPVLAQFCANDPDVLLAAARLVAPHVDGVDLNLGCPQRIAKRGRYGAFLMDDLPLVERLVRALADNLDVPVTVKIRRFDTVAETVAYAALVERAGASLVAVHGRTRAQKQSKACLADWAAIAAVKAALRVPVLANGNIRGLADVAACMAATGADGVMSAESLLEDPALFAGRRLDPGGARSHAEGPQLLLEYLDLCDAHPAPFRMMKGHAFKLIGARAARRSWLGAAAAGVVGGSTGRAARVLNRLFSRIWFRGCVGGLRGCAPALPPAHRRRRPPARPASAQAPGSQSSSTCGTS
jgi:tRNA-dihydrouridine synthase 1